jgi:hypothetical protein
MENPVLHKMTDHDLRQRYKSTYVVYGDQVIYVMDFVEGSMYYKLGGKHDTQIVPFNWRMLNTARPRSMWYVPAGKGYKEAFYLSYPPKKQYHRGLCAENVSVFFAGKGIIGFTLFSTMLLQGFAQPKTDRIVIGKEGIFKDNVLVKGVDEGIFAMFYRRKFLGHIIPKEGKYTLTHERFDQELKEAIEGLEDFKITHAPPPMGIKAILGEVNPFLDLMGDVGIGPMAPRVAPRRGRLFVEVPEAAQPAFEIQVEMFKQKMAEYQRIMPG